MELSDIKILIEIVLVLVGGGFGVGMWQRFTYKKKYEEIKEQLALNEVKMEAMKDEVDKYKANDEKVKIILAFNEDEFDESPEMANKFLKFLKNRLNNGG